MTVNQRDTNDTLAWLKADRDAGRLIWKAKCQMRVRMGRNLPAVQPSALAAQHATPMSERVYDIDKVVRGMIGFADDPNDGNPYGHTYTFIGRDKEHVPVVDTNDALISGGGSVVRYDWFKPNWGDDYQFAAISCNGFLLDLPDVPKPKHPKPKPEKFATLPNLEYGIHRLEKAIVWHEKKHHTDLVKALRKDLAELKETLRKFKKKEK